jgi:hypothetical protein
MRHALGDEQENDDRGRGMDARPGKRLRIARRTKLEENDVLDDDVAIARLLAFGTDPIDYSLS